MRTLATFVSLRAHESKRVRHLPDGSLDLTFHVAGLDEIKRWVLSFGPEMVVLEPEQLREMVREDLGRAYALYGIPGREKLACLPFRRNISIGGELLFSPGRDAMSQR
jgi:hypothetical protein